MVVGGVESRKLDHRTAASTHDELGQRDELVLRADRKDYATVPIFGRLHSWHRLYSCLVALLWAQPIVPATSAALPVAKICAPMGRFVMSHSSPMPEIEGSDEWFTLGVRGVGLASLLSDAGHEIPTALLPSLLTSTLGAPASALGLIEGVSDGLAGLARLGGGALADDPTRHQKVAVGGYATTAVLSAATGGATSAWRGGDPSCRRVDGSRHPGPGPQRLAGRCRPGHRLRPGVWVRAGHGQPGSHHRADPGHRSCGGGGYPLGHAWRDASIRPCSGRPDCA